MRQEICGLTFDQYLQFHREFVALTNMIAEGSSDDSAIIPLLRQHGQEPVFDPDDPEELDQDYYLSCGLKPWEDVIVKDPQLQAKKAMAQVESLQRGIHGDASESTEIEIEGVSLEAYARIQAQHHGGCDLASLLLQAGLSESRWQQVDQAYQAAMSTDATGRLATHYGQIFMQYAPQHAANVTQTVADAMAHNTAMLAESERLEREIQVKVLEMAQTGAEPKAIAALVKKTFPDAADEDELDAYVEPVVEDLAEQKRWDLLTLVLQTRFEILKPGGNRDEWVSDELESAKIDHD